MPNVPVPAAAPGLPEFSPADGEAGTAFAARTSSDLAALRTSLGAFAEALHGLLAAVDRLVAAAERAEDVDLLTPAEAAAWLGLPERRLEVLRHNGGGPEVVRLGGRLRYRPSALEAYVESRIRRSTGAAGEGGR